MNAMFRKMAIQCSVLMSLLAVPPLVSAQSVTAQKDEETQVYTAVLKLMKFPTDQPHILISSVTLNSGCGEKSGNPVLINNCGIFAPPTTAKDLEALLKQQGMPTLSAATWLSFNHENARSETLSDSFKTPWPHVVAEVSTSSTNPWKSIDGAIFLSRVGFSTDRTQAIVYVLFFSYMSGVPTSGNFFQFHLDSGKAWQPVGRVTLMQTQ
jgi:hypothetical protein